MVHPQKKAGKPAVRRRERASELRANIIAELLERGVIAAEMQVILDRAKPKRAKRKL
jgi:hypothetical protein